MYLLMLIVCWMCGHFAGYSSTSGGDKTKKKLSGVPLYALLQADKFTPKHNIDIGASYIIFNPSSGSLLALLISAIT